MVKRIKGSAHKNNDPKSRVKLFLYFINSLDPLKYYIMLLQVFDSYCMHRK